MLLNSSAFKSISAEGKIRETLERLKWGTVHGGYYHDPTTGKAREFDVIGTRYWALNRKRGEQFVGLRILVESKSAEGFHLMFSSMSSGGAFHCGNEIWLGREGEEFKRLVKKSSEIIPESETHKKLVLKFRKAAYPRYTVRLKTLMIDPLPSCSFSAFRETNSDKSKDLDNSVLWRSAQALQSLVRSLRDDSERDSLDELETLWEMNELGLMARSDFDRWIETWTASMELLHPVFVTDASLWLAEGNSLSPLDRCRFVQVNDHGHPVWWMDVVRQDFFQRFATDLTGYYSNKFRSVGAKPK